jgi:hypothetical protein
MNTATHKAYTLRFDRSSTADLRVTNHDTVKGKKAAMKPGTRFFATVKRLRFCSAVFGTSLDHRESLQGSQGQTSTALPLE